MEYKTAQIFGVPIVKMENIYLMNNEEINYIKNLPLVTQNKDDESTKVSKDLFLLNNHSIFNNIKNFIDECAKKFVDEVICVDNNFEITHSWIARSTKKHKKHDHKNTIFSIVYYVQADNAIIRFFRERNFVTKSFNCDVNYNKFNIFNSTNVDFEVKTGDIIIFPGYILHEGINDSNNEKIILGANYFIRGDVGNYNNVTSLTL